MLAPLLLPAPGPARGEVVNRIVATVDGDPITLYDLDQFAEKDVRLRQAPGVDRATILDALVAKRVIDKEIEAKGIAVSDAEIDRYIAGIREKNRLDDAELAAALAQQGMTMEAYRAQVREELLRAQLINREIRGKVNVTPEDVQRYYEAHQDEYGKPGEVAVSHIFLALPADASPEQVEAVMARAGQIHAELESGADFGALAREKSEDAAAESGGKLGTFKSDELLDDLQQAIAGLEPGQFSQPIRSPTGVHIVRLDEQIAGSAEPVAELAEEIRQQLYDAALEERYTRWLGEDLRRRHHVEILP